MQLFTNNAAERAATATLTNKTITYADNTLTGVQPTLVSGTSIKTINSTSLLGSGNLAVGDVVSGGALGTPSSGTLTNCTADGTNAYLARQGLR